MVIIFFSTNAHKAQEISQILQNCEVRLYSEFVEKFSVEENGKTFAQNAKIKLLGLKAKLEKSGFDARQFGGKRVILMAEDSGICVEALDGRPGIYSARYALNASLRASNSVLGMQFRTCGNFRTSTDSSLVESPKISTNTKATPQSLRLRFCESQNLSENNAKNAESNADSANIAQIITELNSLNIAESSAQFISCVACCDISQNLAQEAQILTAHGFLNGKVITQIRGNNGFGYDPIFVPNGFSQTLGELGTEAKNALSHRANALQLMALLLK